MVDGIYQSVMVFFISYLAVSGSAFVTFNGLNIEDRVRLGCYIAHPAVLTINLYILINTYRWDWLMLLVVAISDLFMFFWTGVYTSSTGSGVFYRGAAQVYGEGTFWAVFFLTPVVCIFPRFAIKALQKVYYPYDVDIIREQERQGKFTRLNQAESTVAGGKQRTSSGSSKSPRKASKHFPFSSVDEESRPIYPPSVATHGTHGTQTLHSQNGSDGTTYTDHRQSLRQSLDPPPAVQPLSERPRPSYDRIRASMDRVRPSYEASNEFTSAARLSRIESSQSSGQHRLRNRLRGLSLSKSTAN